MNFRLDLTKTPRLKLKGVSYEIKRVLHMAVTSFVLVVFKIIKNLLQNGTL